jgi:photosystem II stability/assembly factor-like uncharacterized protein
MTNRIKVLAFLCFSFVVLISFPGNVSAKEKPAVPQDTLKSSTFSGLKLRSIGPAFTSGRIACLAVNPANHSEYFVGAASGSVWKTINSGTTFEPVFDNYGAYAIGSMAMDPSNHNVVWLGTGENHHQRAMGYGDGIYKTVNGGKSWENMGLKESRQIGGILIDPTNTDIVYAAAEGSLWASGSDRGLYKTTDGGKNWKKILHVSDETGINNILMEPDDPNVLFATSEQRRRHIFSKIGGGPETALYKSTDKGETWRKITRGLPSVDMGGTGLALSPADHNVMYIIIEAAEGESGFYRSNDRGESWEKMSDYNTAGQYYGDITCDPIDPDKIFSLETVSKISEDAGKTWQNIGNDNRHVDDHALWVDPSNTSHFMIGGDGGLYETFDGGKKFLFKSNLPVTQFYRVGLDNDYPFYNVYGGTQDNNTFGGPSASTSSEGVSSEEWYPVLGGDGFWVRIDPSDPNLVYCEYQYGNLYRYDKKSGELLYIKPQPTENELSFKWNWNSPMILSSHSNQRLYIAANKVFRSDDRGASWTTISGDITTQTDRNTWPVMGRYWSSDAVAKDVSTSLWGTAVSIEESPINENLLFAGTDDGVVSITEDAGKTWKTIKSFPGIPEYTYISDILASKHNENIVYVSFDNHQRDDFKPYVLMSSDKGKTWKSITSNLPVRGTVHTLEQDFLQPDLLFAGTEFGVFFSIDGGTQWVQIKEGIPTIPVRDMAIQKRENDLVLASFGRGFYILDDYSPLRKLAEDKSILKSDSYLFPVEDALMYKQTGKKYGQGASLFSSANPAFGACFTFYMKDTPKTQREIRKDKEAELFKNKQPIPQLSIDEQRIEAAEESAYLLFSIFDESGKLVRKITSSPKKGINRISWDLCYDSPYPVNVNNNKYSPLSESRSGITALPGTYKVSAEMISQNGSTSIGVPVTFKAVSLNNSTLPAADKEALVSFQKEVADVAGSLTAIIRETHENQDNIIRMRQTIMQSLDSDQNIMNVALKIDTGLKNLLYKITGPEAKASQEEIPPRPVPAEQRLGFLTESSWSSSSSPTPSQKETLAILKKQLPEFKEELKGILSELEKLKKQMDEKGMKWTPGRGF